MVDGKRLVGDLVRWQVAIEELYVDDDADLEPLVVAAARSMWRLDGDVLARLAPTRHPQGVLAVVAEPSWPRWSGRSGVALYLDRLQDPGNVGAVVRSAAALGAAAVLLSPDCADPFHPLAVRGSAGAVLRLPVERDVPAAAAAERVRGNRGSVWAASKGGSDVSGWRPQLPTVLMIGAEGAGLSDAALACADDRVAVPLRRGIESLNVAVAAGVLLYHLGSAA